MHRFGWSRLGPVALVVALVASTTACDPYGVPAEPTEASVTVELGPAGGAEISLFPGGRPARDRLLALGTTLADVLPDGRARPARVDPNGGGSPFLVIDVEHAYVPGKAARVRVDMRNAVERLERAGVVHVDLDVTGPDVRAAARWDVTPDDVTHDSWSWYPVPPSHAPAGEVVLRPAPWEGWFQVGLVLLSACALVGGAVAVARGRWWQAAFGGVVPIAASATAVVTAGVAAVDALGVSGALPGNVLDVIRTVVAVSFVVGLLAGPGLLIALLCVALARGGRTPSRTAVPPVGLEPTLERF